MSMAAAAPPVSCSASGGSEEGFSWAAAAATENEPTGSTSGSSVAFQDTNPLMAVSSMDWNQALMSGGRAETSFHGMFHQDLSSSNSFFRQEPSIDLSMNPFKDMNQSLLNQHRLSSGVAPSVGLVSAPSENYQSAIMGYRGISNELSQPSSWPEFTQLIDASPPPMQQSRDPSQFSSSTQFWNSLGSAGSMESSGLYPNLMTTQFASQSMEQKPSSSSTSFNTKLSSKGTRDSSSSTTKKNNTVGESAMKKPRIETPSPLPTFKVRKEKLGDRVTALQQLVSPFGKTDTASVLHETIDYIKFLHDQVKVLSAPYLNNGQPMQHQQINPNESKDEEGPPQDLKSRGLCLVPVSSTYPVASEIPADFWSPPFGGLFSWNSTGRDETTFPLILQEGISSRAYFKQGISMNSNQISTGNQGSLMVNTLKDSKQSFLDCSFKSYPVGLPLHGYPKMVMQRPFAAEAEALQFDHANTRSVGYRSQVTAIAGVV